MAIVSNPKKIVRFMFKCPFLVENNCKMANLRGACSYAPQID